MDHTSVTAVSKQLYFLKGNALLLLDDPRTFWVLQSGSLALFSTTTADGVPEGARRYLCSVEPAEALFGSVPCPEEGNRSLLAVAVEETQLLKLSQEDLRERFTADHHGEITLLVEGWVSKLGAVLWHVSPPTIHVQVSGPQKCSLSHSEHLGPQPKTVVWVHVQQGSALWMGVKECPLDPTSPPFPLGPGMWLEADGAVELATVQTPAITDIDTLFAGLSHLSRLFLRYLAILEQREAHTTFQQFLEGQRLNQQRREETIKTLASVLRLKQSPVPSPEGTPFFVAASAVGAVLGITIRAPAASEDLTRVKSPLEAIARASHIRMRTVLLTDTWWKKDHGPLFAYTQEDTRPVALLPVTATRYELFDPVTMTRTPVQRRLASTLAPIAYTFYRSFPDTVLRSLDLLKFGLQNHGKDLIVVLLTGLAATLLGMLTPQMMSILIDQAIPDADHSILFQIGLALLAAAFGQTLFQIAQGVALMRYRTGLGHASQAAMWDRLLSLRPAFFRQYATGDLLSRVTTVSTILEKLSGTTMRTLFSSCLALLNLGLMFSYSWQLASVATVVALLAIIATTYSGFLTVCQVRPLQKFIGELFGVTVQLINGVPKLRVAGAEERAFAYWGEKFHYQQRLWRRIQRIEDSITVFNTILPTLASAVIFWFAMRTIQEAAVQREMVLTAGTFLAFNAAFGTFIGGATSLSTTIIDLLDVSTLLERARPILEGTPEVDANKLDPGRLSGQLALEHVTFRYREGGAIILDDMSIHAAPGEFIALVGPSGCGKSTIFRLLLGFDIPEAGTVYYDDQDLARLDVHAVRRQLGTVLQSSKLMSASIFENIAGNSSITLDEAWEAVRAAGLADDIKDMPMGMHSYISEGGTNLSGGQRQRLLIARALVAKPKILLFDEATSALDNRTQAIVSESLAKMRATRVVIAHRLSTIRNADCIYVLDKGRVVQQGHFDELAAQVGLFAQLMARQTI